MHQSAMMEMEAREFLWRFVELAQYIRVRGTTWLDAYEIFEVDRLFNPAHPSRSNVLVRACDAVLAKATSPIPELCSDGKGSPDVSGKGYNGFMVRSVMMFSVKIQELQEAFIARLHSDFDTHNQWVANMYMSICSLNYHRESRGAAWLTRTEVVMGGYLEDRVAGVEGIASLPFAFAEMALIVFATSGDIGEELLMDIEPTERKRDREPSEQVVDEPSAKRP